MISLKIKSFAKSFTILSTVYIFQLWIFRDLAQHLSTKLLDWLDYPLVVFLTTTQTGHFLGLELGQLTESLMFTPNNLSMFFSDTFIVQGLLELPFLAITQQPILSFNLALFLTFFLNTLAAFKFIKGRFEKMTVFVGTLFLSISPFLILNRGHFQLLSIWPTYFGLSFLFKPKQHVSDFAWLGLWLVVQFYASVYLFLLLGFLILLWLVFKIWKETQRKVVIQNSLIMMLIALVGTGWGIYHYWTAKNKYDAPYQYSEYVQYAADPADYLSISSYHSLFDQLPTKQLYDLAGGTSYGKIGFVGFGLLILAIIGLRSIHQQQRLTLPTSLLTITMIPLGWLFSLGPRLTIYGNYTTWRLPYDLIVKFVPLVSPMRVTARWSLWFYLGIVFLAITGFDFLWKKRKRSLALLLVFLFLAEIIPTNLKTTSKDFYPQIYNQISAYCGQNNDRFLEYPMSLSQADHSAAERVGYWSSIILPISFHNCPTINGYSGFFPPTTQKIETELSSLVDQNDISELMDFLVKNEVGVVKINHSAMREEQQKFWRELSSAPDLEYKIVQDEEYSLLFSK